MAPDAAAIWRNALSPTRTVLHKALADAVMSELVPINVADRAHVPKHDPDAPITPRRLNYWDEDETRRFLAATADDPLHGIWQFALGTGMRRGELLGLRWEDVNLDNLQLRVTTALTEVDGIHVHANRRRWALLRAERLLRLFRSFRSLRV